MSGRHLVASPGTMQGTWVQSLGQEEPLEKGKTTHGIILAWRFPSISVSRCVFTALDAGISVMGHVPAACPSLPCVSLSKTEMGLFTYLALTQELLPMT